MAKKTQILLVDDVDGGEAHETVEFGLDGKAYEIDLSSKNAKKLRDGLATYVAEGHKVGRKRVARKGRAAVGGASPADIREWARVNGYEVSERGRVRTEIREAYFATH